MLAAIRYRPAQAALLALLSAIVVGCAAFAPLYERALEQSLVRAGLARLSSVGTAVELSNSGPADRLDPARIQSVMPASLVAAYGPGRTTWHTIAQLNGHLGTGTVSVWSTAAGCPGLTLQTGRCPQSPFEVLVSTQEAALEGWPVGTALAAKETYAPPGQTSPPFPTPMTVVGTYTQVPDDPAWLGITLAGRAGGTAPGLVGEPLMDALVTSESTFAPMSGDGRTTWRAWGSVMLTVTYILDRDRIGVDDIAGLASTIARAQSEGLAAETSGLPRVTLRTGLGELGADILEGQRQARVIVPLLMAQLALLAVVVLGLVASSAVEQRRQEIALARLRGAGRSGAGRRVLAELGLAVTLGAPVGLLGAWLAVALARAAWLTPGVPAEVPALTVPAAVLGWLVAMAALGLAIRPTLDEPIATLLRRVPPRRGRLAIGVADALVIGVSAAALVGLATGNLSGPLALAAPALLALAVGLVLAHALVPLAAALARRYAERGRVGSALAAAHIARRPAVRRIVTMVTVATALSVFSADALVVGARNRELRARIEAGARVVLGTDTTEVPAALEALRAVDPDGSRVTPVVWSRQFSADAITTMAVDPAHFTQVADLAVEREAFDLSPLTAPPPASPTVTGTMLSVTVTSGALHVGNDPTAPPGAVVPDSVPLAVLLKSPNAASLTVTLGRVPLVVSSPIALSARVDCTTPCSVVGLRVDRELGDMLPVEGSLTLDQLTAGQGSPADLGRPGLWLPHGTQDIGQYAIPEPQSATAVRVLFNTIGSPVEIRSSVDSAPLPGLVVGGVPPGTTPGNSFQVAGLDGLAVQVSEAAPAPYAPGGRATRVAITSLPSLLTRAHALSATANLELFVADPTLVEPLRAALGQRGISVTGVRDQTARQALYDSSASAWGLRLALVVAVLAVVLAALVLLLVALTAWRGRVRDLAALRLAGIPTATLRRASIAEQTVVVIVAGLVGAACGVLAAQLALPIVPFFTVPSDFFHPDLTLAGPAVLGAWVAGLVVLVAVAVLVATSLVRRAGVARVREGQ